MLRAVAFGSRLLPTRPVKDFHLQSSAHAGHTNAQWRLSGPDGAVSVGVNARVAANGMSFLRSLALRGLGIVLYPEAIARDDIAHGRLSRVLEEYASAESAIYALYPSGRHVSPNVRAFLDIAAEAWATDEPTSRIAAL